MQPRTRLATLLFGTVLLGSCGEPPPESHQASSVILSFTAPISPTADQSAVAESRPYSALPAGDRIRAHAVAFGAILNSFNGEPLTDLKAPSGEVSTQVMADWWDIHSRADLLAMLDAFDQGQEGHRMSFWETHPQWSPGDAIPLTGWDFGRYINLCRWGFNAGYLSEDEAWARMLPVARLLQASFHSWSDYAADYLRGRIFWSPKQTAIDGEKVRMIIAGLVHAPDGLWDQIPWSDSLGEGPIAADPFAAAVRRQAQFGSPVAQAGSP